MIPHSKVFVGGLPSGSKPHELRRLFENYGVVTECDIMNRCGFVHMETPKMAETAIRGLHNTMFKGSVITVEPGRPKDRNAGAGGGGSGGGVRHGGSSAGPDRRINDRGGMVSGPPRGGFGPPHGGGGEERDGGRGEGGVGPIRRDRGGGGGPRRGSEPYNRNPRGGYQDNFQGGGGGRGRNFDSNSGSSNYNTSPRNSYGVGGSMSGTTGYSANGNSGSFGAINQDKRGFALPDQQFRGARGSMSQGGRNNPFSRPMPTHTDGAGSGGFGSQNPFGSSRGRGSMDPNGGRQGGDRSTNRFRGEQNSAGGGQGDRNYSINQNYNEAFPPLNATVGQRGGFRGRGGGPRGGGFGRGAPPNRNGPPRGGGMMSNRFQ